MRLGTINLNETLSTNNTGAPLTTTGVRHFELTNHLGNVPIIFSDAETEPRPDGAGGTVTVPKIIAHQDYTAFGLEWHRSADLQGRERYRYGFNGKEQDSEGEWGSQTHYDYGFRIYNPAVARFLSVDPLAPDYPELTPYQFASNRPIDGVDFDGLEYQDAEGVWHGDGGVYTRVIDDHWIYARVESGKSIFYHNPNGYWERIYSNLPQFGKYRHIQTGTGFGLSYNGIDGVDKWTEEVKNTFAGLLAIGGGGPLVAAAGSAGGLTSALSPAAQYFASTLPSAASLEGGFALKLTLKGGGMRVGADFLAQAIMHKVGRRDDSFIKNYNLAGLINAAVPGAAYANGFSAYFNFSFNAYQESKLTNTAEQGIIGFGLGGIFGVGSSHLLGSSAVTNTLGEMTESGVKDFSKVFLWKNGSESINLMYPNLLGTFDLGIGAGSNLMNSAGQAPLSNKDE